MMKKVLLGLLVTLLFLGCAKDEAVAVKSKMAVGESLEALALKDQYDKPQSLSAETKKVIFAFSKEMGHMSNEYFDKQEPSFLSEHNAVFIADVSSAPSLIRSMFIMPGLKEFNHPVLVIDDENIAASYRIDANRDKLMIVDLEYFIIKKISFVETEDELAKVL